MPKKGNLTELHSELAAAMGTVEIMMVKVDKLAGVTAAAGLSQVDAEKPKADPKAKAAKKARKAKEQAKGAAQAAASDKAAKGEATLAEVAEGAAKVGAKNRAADKAPAEKAPAKAPAKPLEGEALRKDLLRQANTLGVKVHPNSGIEKLKTALEAHHKAALKATKKATPVESPKMSDADLERAEIIGKLKAAGQSVHPATGIDKLKAKLAEVEKAKAAATTKGKTAAAKK
jgi:hypothetical protein